ncbi:MAG: nucleoside hydrolase [Ilumatobacteraceae bacterium]
MLRPFFIDTDTASDDAVALVIALTHPDVEVVGISVVAGNVPLDLGVQNALWVAEQCNASVPVHAGAATPLVVALETGQYVHGADGMGDIGLPLTGRTPASDDGVGALLAASHRYAGQLELVTLGPLTNLALALRADPTLPERLARCVVMGAVADHVGNQTPVAEFNMWVDPHSVDEVLRSGLEVELVGWDVSRRDAVFDADAAEAMRSIGTPKRAGPSTSNVCSSSSATRRRTSTGSTSPIRSPWPTPSTRRSPPRRDASHAGARRRAS